MHEPARTLIEPRDVTRLGDATRHRGLCSPDVEERREPWCEHLSACPLLPEFGIRHFGIVEASEDYCFERHTPREAMFLASLQGTGRAGSATAITLLPAGHGMMFPKQCPRLYSNAGAHSWHLGWICFESSCPLVAGVEVSRFPVDPDVFHHVLEALTAAWTRYRNPATTLRMIDVLVDLVKMHLRIRPEVASFHKAWQSVIADLGAAWSAPRIAALAACSPESFRRACWDEFNTSPMRYLAGLRLGRARILLASTTLTIDEISDQLGYSDPYSLSHAFKRQYGVSPSEFRKHSAGNGSPGAFRRDKMGFETFPGNTVSPQHG